MQFGEALEVIRSGGRVRRPIWSEGAALYLVAGSRFAVNREPLLSILGEGTEIDYQPHMDLLVPPTEENGLTVAISQVWQINQRDVLAEDWERA